MDGLIRSSTRPEGGLEWVMIVNARRASKPQPKSSRRSATVRPGNTRSGSKPRGGKPKAGGPPAVAENPRLQKVLAMCGYGSRRQCEELITDGRVEIDRTVVTELGVRVDPETQQVRVDGVTLKMPRFKYFLLHKPVNVISTARDPWARTRVIDLVADADRLFTVGRLDKSSSGLILVTNDGDLAHQLTHPSFEVEKTYHVVVAGNPTRETLKQLRDGVYLAEGKASVERITVRKA
ncbi:MAG: rRNA pseudouridine synthase, partial [Planctomycetales bacterium]|nr:rRNA pseudouridine synthase [Planctomycetales bacterium]